ncbi:DNA primase [Lysobacter solisilvae (ex Woo and Kim 2020)]|uniref:DNA primase n=1 Tax=Agrilutibacter terrestris TaxID=2865112 RepID=A0A7H0FZ32_9GAMM|nr:DNA primase [Lysobacter terrestris]QNP41298.1 DNA primase [Lysobacter terrestris]
MTEPAFALEWEKLANEGASDTFTTERARVFGGWLVRLTAGTSQSLAFVPDGEGRWDGEDFGEDDYEYEDDEEESGEEDEESEDADEEAEEGDE